MDNGAGSKRGRLMGKLFGSSKERKISDATTANNLDSFLHSSDNLQVTHPPPPPPPTTLPKLDTTISRYPQAVAVNQQAQLNRPIAPGRLDLSATKAPRSPRPNRKGLLIHFSDARPEIIGEGGDECEIPTIEISRKKLARSPQPPIPPAAAHPPAAAPTPAVVPPQQRVPVAPTGDIFRPKRITRTQTGYSSIYSPEPQESNGNTDYPAKWRESPPPLATQPKLDLPSRPATSGLLASPTSDENRKSFIETQQAQMRRAEGQAFAQAARNSSVAYDGNWEDGAPPAAAPPTTIAESPQNYPARRPLDYSPAASLTSLASSTYAPSLPSPDPNGARSGFPQYNEDPRPMAARMASLRLNDSVGGESDEALEAFVLRTTHLHELFRLHAETITPLQNCELRELGRAGLWWFLKGRLGLEQAIREHQQPNTQATPKGQMQNELDKQQAYANLTKAYWLCQHAIPETSQTRRLPPDPEILAATEQLMSSLKKLAMSMKRNGFLPTEEPFLPATIDKAIWLEYPAMSQDMVALLSGNWGSGISAIQKPTTNMQILNALPLTDMPDFFSYGRVAADCFLMEQGREAQRYYFSCFLSMLRPKSETGLVFIIASQNGVIQLAIQDNRGAGPVWEDVRWRNDTCTLELRLPRGFMIAVQLLQADYRMLWNMYDFGARVRSMLKPRPDETVVFRNTLPAFQYIDSDPQSRAFPKDSVPGCEVALFERMYKENGPAGPRNWHAGFRVAAVTGPRTRTLSGVQHNYPPLLPVQFGFFRGEGNAPALSLKFEGSRQKGRMVLSFTDEKERVRFHSLITGTALEVDERIFANVPLRSLQISERIRDMAGILPFGRMPWRAAQIINDEFGPNGEQPTSVLSDKLKVVVEYQNGMVTDRINVAPGEMRLRLDVSNQMVFRMLRQPQADMTVSISEAQVPKELPTEMSHGLNMVRQKQTIRTLEFNSLKDLHEFQFAVTGYEVIFDAMATTFAIARRRMVVPIHKKWEAGLTRIQVVRQEDKQVQLLAFFENWQHGHCMNFLLKGTDVYESFQRSGKSGIKFVDAKFPLPRVPEEKDGDFDDMAFVCLDLPDLPGEHDDISIVFEKELDRDRLCLCLPAAVKGSGRLSRLK